MTGEKDTSPRTDSLGIRREGRLELLGLSRFRGRVGRVWKNGITLVEGTGRSNQEIYLNFGGERKSRDNGW